MDMEKKDLDAKDSDVIDWKTYFKDSCSKCHASMQKVEPQPFPVMYACPHQVEIMRKGLASIKYQFAPDKKFPV